MSGIKQFLKQFAWARAINAAITNQKPLDDSIDLNEVGSRLIPRNEGFDGLVQRANTVEGMLSLFSMAVLDTLLSAQNQIGALGNILEIGTYKGKSAVILGRHLQGGERLTLVDIHEYLDRNAIEPFKSSVDFIVTNSDKLRQALPSYRKKRGTYRFIHIDASHGFRETYNELRMAEELLAPGGIIALDDFANLNYSQNIASIFRYLFTESRDLVMFLVTDEKGYVCRKRDADRYLSHVFNSALAEMRSRGVEATLARTCLDPQYRAFYLRGRQAGEGAFYGPELYRTYLIGS